MQQREARCDETWVVGGSRISVVPAKTYVPQVKRPYSSEMRAEPHACACICVQSIEMGPLSKLCNSLSGMFPILVEIFEELFVEVNSK